MWRSDQLSYGTLSQLRPACETASQQGAFALWVSITESDKRQPRRAEPDFTPPSPCTHREADASFRVSRKEVFQPHLPVRLPCYDLAPITGLTLGRPSRSRPSGTPGFHGLTGGVYKARERIHRAMADARLLANPASWSRVADSSPNWGGLWGSARSRLLASPCNRHCNTCVAPDVRAVLI